jgi:hypothetical protein
MNRRQLSCATRLGLVGAVSHAAVLLVVSPDAKNQPKPLTLTDDEPRSSLGVREARVSRSRFPLIDIHTHISVSAKSKHGVKIAPERQCLGAPDELLAGIDLKNMGSMVNLTGGNGAGLLAIVFYIHGAFPFPVLKAGLSEAAGTSYGTGAQGRARGLRFLRCWGSV